MKNYLMRRLMWGGMIGLSLSSCGLFEKKDIKGISGKTPTAVIVKADTAKRTADTGKGSGLKPYQVVVTKKAITDSGLFIVHKLEDKYFFEVPFALLDKDILMVSRIAQASAALRDRFQFYGFSGDQMAEKVIRLCKGPGDKLFIRTISYQERSNDSTENGMFRSVRLSNLPPIAASFDIKAYNKDTTSLVVELTDYLNNDQAVFFSDPEWKKTLGLGAMQKDMSYIEGVRSLPINAEVQTVKTYSTGEGTATYTINTSLVLLPENVMKPRYLDERIGYFSTGYLDFDLPAGAKPVSIVTRWRLEPKQEDIERYLKGELVTPRKPIVFYIDPATPKKWVPYLIQGVNDWQKAFEKAGFKNAIYALEAPQNDSSWSLFDARHSAIIYKPSMAANAMGPQIHDPRSGEILESHVHWFHNVQLLLRNWYFIQAAPNDPRARKMQFDDELMGNLIHFVCAHEVGHTLGLAHNFGSSSTVPVDSLRSKTFLATEGHTPSIMDYARFNYAAQQDDGIDPEYLMPRIGAYDKWAIEWGYRWFVDGTFKNKQNEESYMNRWITRSLEKNKRLWYGPQRMEIIDPRCQFEDLGDDAVKAGDLGIKNLKRVMKHLVEWTVEPSKDNYDGLTQMYNGLINQYLLYMFHVMNNVDNNYINNITRDQKQKAISFVDKSRRKKAVVFLHRNLFETPRWLLDTTVMFRTNNLGFRLLALMQDQVISGLVNPNSFQPLNLQQQWGMADAYSFDDLLSDLERGIWKELNDHSPVDMPRRMLQKIYAERLIAIIDIANTPDVLERHYTYWKARIDYPVIVRNHANHLIQAIDKALPSYTDRASRMHFQFIRDRLKKALSNEMPMYPPSDPPQSMGSGSRGLEADQKPVRSKAWQNNCWAELDWLNSEHPIIK